MGIDAFQWSAFQSTIKCIFPVVQEMVDRMCEEAKPEMKTIVSQLGQESLAASFLSWYDSA